MSTISSMLSNLLQDYKKSISVTDGTSPISPVTNDNTPSDGYGDAYVLDLSQAAQDILKSKSSTSIIKLDDTQKAKLKDILDKYKDQPDNSETLAKLYADLQKAGLAPDELATIQSAKDFNPVIELLKILNSLNNNSSPDSSESTLSGLSSTASGTPLGNLLEQFKANNTGSLEA